MLERLPRYLTVAAVDLDVVRVAVSRCAERGFRSGAVFDAIHLAVAEAARVDALATFNARDFERLSTAGSPRVVVPLESPAAMLG